MIQPDRLIRNAILILGLFLVVGGTAAQSVPGAAIVLGGLLMAGAVTGMWLTRRG